MKKQMNNLRHLHWALPCMLLFAGCESSDNENREPVELQIAPVVATTRNAIQEATGMDKVAVYATGDDYTDVKSNNYAVYTWSSNSWGNSGTDKIFLTNKAATIHGYYPTTTKYDDKLEIDVTLLEGTESTTIAVVDNAASNSTAIASAVGEVDCMWANKVENISNADNASNVTLKMNHALSMVSFRVYKADSYKGPGSLTKFVVSNVSNGTTLSKGTNPKMNITTGAITAGTEAAAMYTRSIDGGYTLTDAEASSKKFSILVLPISTSIGNDKIQATFTVDGTDYSVNLTAPQADGKWLAGKNHLYTVKLSGTEVSIATVEVTKWEEVVGGNLEIK